MHGEWEFLYRTGIIHILLHVTATSIAIAYKLWQLGFLKVDFAPVNICKTSKTTLSFSEVESKEGKQYDCYVLFDSFP